VPPPQAQKDSLVLSLLLPTGSGPKPDEAGAGAGDSAAPAGSGGGGGGGGGAPPSTNVSFPPHDAKGAFLLHVNVPNASQTHMFPLMVAGVVVVPSLRLFCSFF
jgi:hypothetical protein